MLVCPVASDGLTPSITSPPVELTPVASTGFGISLLVPTPFLHFRATGLLAETLAEPSGKAAT